MLKIFNHYILVVYYGLYTAFRYAGLGPTVSYVVTRARDKLNCKNISNQTPRHALYVWTSRLVTDRPQNFNPDEHLKRIGTPHPA